MGKFGTKLNPSTVSVEPGVCQNIVGVDGHAIQVCGSVKIPVTISDRIFEPTFIIADGITAGGILGMDFLEDNKCVFGDKSLSNSLNPCLLCPQLLQ